jgi:hypothetical protein
MQAEAGSGKGDEDIGSQQIKKTLARYVDLIIIRLSAGSIQSDYHSLSTNHAS